MTNQYELVFIMTPVLSEEQREVTLKKYKKILTDGEAVIIFEDNWGLRKMAYPIQKKSTGFYYLIEFESPGNLISQLELNFNRDEQILRFLTVKLDKYAIIYNEKKRKKPKDDESEPEHTSKYQMSESSPPPKEAPPAESETKAADPKTLEEKPGESDQPKQDASDVNTKKDNEKEKEEEQKDTDTK